jgi:hypothetical protein
MYTHCHLSITIPFFLTLMFLQVQKILLAQGTKAALYHGKMGKKERTDSHMYVLGQ